MKKSPLFLTILVGLVLALGAAACGDDEDEPASESSSTEQSQSESPPSAEEAEAETPPGTNEPNAGGEPVRSERVEMIDYEFAPADITIATGGKVTWINQGQQPHNAVADDDTFKTDVLDAGKLASETFDEPGTYSYICTIHPQMKGTIEVTD